MRIKVGRVTYMPWWHTGFGSKIRKKEWGSRYRTLYILGFYIHIN